jgi:hypothetical protein
MAVMTAAADRIVLDVLVCIRSLDPARGGDPARPQAAPPWVANLAKQAAYAD